jgi:LCP family protein required for cell wall assembly
MKDDNMPSEAGQSDCIILLTLDKSKKEARILQIPRDTMTEVDVYNVGGYLFTTLQAQIATQYAYHIGGASSCMATKKTVSELLYDLPIDGYLAMDYTNIATVNDAIGGVEITVPQDYTMINPAFTEGTTLRLMGEQAHDYVRWRDINQSFSLYDRMDRQVQYILAMLDALQVYVKENKNDYTGLYSIVEENMVTNLSEEQIEKLLGYQLDAENIEILPGEAKKGEIYEEFYVNEEKLQKMLIEMFYILEE